MSLAAERIAAPLLSRGGAGQMLHWQWLCSGSAKYSRAVVRPLLLEHFIPTFLRGLTRRPGRRGRKWWNYLPPPPCPASPTTAHHPTPPTSAHHRWPPHPRTSAHRPTPYLCQPTHPLHLPTLPPTSAHQPTPLHLPSLPPTHTLPYLCPHFPYLSPQTHTPPYRCPPPHPLPLPTTPPHTPT